SVSYGHLDKDGDGISDKAETKLGTDANDASDMPASSPVKASKVSAGASVDFKKNTGKCTLKANLTVPNGFNADGKKAVVQFGEAAMLFLFGPKNKATG